MVISHWKIYVCLELDQWEIVINHKLIEVTWIQCININLVCSLPITHW